MSHQPFETWILDVETLPMEERRSLQAHLETCPQCQKLHSKWQAVHYEMRAKRMVAPAPGFTQRWSFSLVERRAREQRKQAWRIFLGCLGVALLVLLTLAGYVAATSSPADLLTAIIRTLTGALNLASMAQFAVRTWLAATPLALNIALWIYLALTLCLLTLAWVFALWRTSIIGVFNR